MVSTLPDLSLVNLFGQVISHYNLSIQLENKIKRNDKRVKLLKKVSLTLQIYLIVLQLLFYEEVFLKDLLKIPKKRNNYQNLSKNLGRKEKKKKDTILKKSSLQLGN